MELNSHGFQPVVENRNTIQPREGLNITYKRSNDESFIEFYTRFLQQFPELIEECHLLVVFFLILNIFDSSIFLIR